MQELSLPKRVLAASKQKIEISQSRYLDWYFVLPRSNICEELFSTAGYTFHDSHKSALAANIEMQLSLHANKRL